MVYEWICSYVLFYIIRQTIQKKNSWLILVTKQADRVPIAQKAYSNSYNNNVSLMKLCNMYVHMDVSIKIRSASKGLNQFLCASNYIVNVSSLIVNLRYMGIKKENQKCSSRLNSSRRYSEPLAGLCILTHLPALFYTHLHKNTHINTHTHTSMHGANCTANSLCVLEKQNCILGLASK